MRVTGGRARGRRLYAPKSDRIRVTSDRVRESLFDILPPMEGLAFLDIYAGTGSVGIEALSRGGAGAVFVERDALHAGVLQRNLDLCGFREACEVMIASAERGVHLLSEHGRKFDVIFADPPYDRGLAASLLGLSGTTDLIAKDGILVVEHSSREEVIVGGAFVPVDRRRYGDTVLSFLKSIG